MTDKRDDTVSELARDIAHALRQSPFRVKPSRGGPDVVSIVASDVVRHLLISGWLLHRRPPTKPHSAG